MKLGDIPYNRIEIEGVRSTFDTLCSDFANAKDAQAQFAVYKRYDAYSRTLSSMATLANIRFTQNVEDKFYNGEMDYYDEITPECNELGAKFKRQILNSAFIDKLTELISPEVVQRYGVDIKLYDPVAAEEYKQENKLMTQYTKLMSSGTVEFRGETLAITELNKYKSDNDRATRKEAFDVHGKFLQDNSDEIDTIFDQLVKVRTAAAKKLGYDNYVQYAYDMRGRNSYGIDDVAKFRENVLKHIVPAVAKIKQKQAKELGIEKVMLYDDPIVLKQGLPKPKGTPEEIMQAGGQMYSEMSPITAEFMDYMLEHDSFDVIARKGKSGGGYCTSIPDYKLPFIFSNFNGTSDDIDVLTHEAGHALFDYTTKDREIFDRQVGSGMETYEVHSMAMEFFAIRWMDLFFTENDAKDYKRAHFANAFSFLPYGTIVDYFQQLIYTNPELTPQERNGIWKDLESKFRPYLSSEGITYIQNGTRWQYQAHIFLNPFYYIDYCVAQSVAFNFLQLINRDWDAAWQKYMAFMQSSHLKFKEILESVGLDSPFGDEALKNIAKTGEESY